MRIYYAGLTGRVLKKYHDLYPERKLNVLFSHGRQNSEADDFHTKYRSFLNSLILDSGTWTLKTSQNPVINITPETYRDWVLANGHHYDFYFGFDEDYDKDGFYINNKHQIFLEKAGLKPVPVIRDIDGEEVDYYINRNHKFLAIGSSEVVGAEKIRSIVWRLFEQGIKVHLFGTTRFEYLIDAPVFSCDSTTWTRTGGDNKILFWNEENSNKNKRDVIGLEHYTYQDKKPRNMYMSYDYKAELDKYLEEELQLTYPDLLGYNTLFNCQLVNLHYFTGLENLINDNHKRCGFKW